MGVPLTKMFTGSKQMHILVVGLDRTGKTTTLRKLDLGDIHTSMPTLGFSIRTLEYKNLLFTICRFGDPEKARPQWRGLLRDVQGIIFVLDSSDRERIQEVREELQRLLDEDERHDAALLILANKQDLDMAMDVSDVKRQLGLDNINNRQWTLRATSAVTGDGLYDSMEWLVSAMKNKA